MSNDKDLEAIEDFKKNIAEEEKYENLKHETSKKKILIEAERVDLQLEQLKQNKLDIKLAREANFGALTPEQIAEIQRQNDDYIIAAKNSMRFINKNVFGDAVPFFRKNLIMIGAQTGYGKSTAVANIAFSVKDEINAITGKRRRTLILTNEERAEDVYNRVTALSMGWSYTNHSSFTDKQAEVYRKAIPAWAEGGLITVIDNTHGGGHGVTTSIEGVEAVFENLIANQEWYDCIIIDYYQNIIQSKKDPNLNQYQVQERMARMLDRYKNVYPAPIILMAQMKPLDKEEKTPYQERVKGSKAINDACTFIFEMSSEFDNYLTKWAVHKSRFTQTVGKAFQTGWDKGRYVEYNNEFIAKIEALKLEIVSRKIDKVAAALNNKPIESEEKDGN